MIRLFPLLAALLLGGCQDLNARGLALLIDEDYAAEVVVSGRDGLASPDGLLWQDDRLFIADEGGAAIRSWRPGGPLRTIATGGGMSTPEDLVRDQDGNIFFSDDESGGVFRIGSDGRLSRPIGPERGLPSTEAIARHPSGDLLIGDGPGHRILRAGRDGRLAIVLGPEHGISKPESMAFDDAGNLYIADNQEDVLYLLTGDGRLHRPIANRPGFSPESIWYAGGTLYITDSKSGVLHRYSPEAGLATLAVFRGDLANIQGVTTDKDGNIYLSVQTDIGGRRGYILRLNKSRPPAENGPGHRSRD